jgi:hypothetical protein
MRKFLEITLELSILAVFFFVPWWLRPEWMPTGGAYYTGFLIFIPVAASIVAWILLGVPGLREALGDRRLWWIGSFALLVWWALLSPHWAGGYAARAMGAAQQFAVVALFALVVVCAGPTARSVVVALAMGLTFQAIIVIAQVAFQTPVGLSSLGEFEIRPFRRGLSILYAAGEFLMRPYGLTIHPNVIAGYFVTSLLCLTGFVLTEPMIHSRWRQVVRLSALALGLWALYLTFSRAAVGGLGVGLALIALSWLRPGSPRPNWKTARWLAIGAVALTLVFALTYSRFILARAGVGEELTEQRSISDRRIFNDIALQVIQEQPIRGVGMDVFTNRAHDILNHPAYSGPGKNLRGDHVHNIALLVISELGFVGFTFWILTLAIGFWFSWRHIYDPSSVGLIAGVAALLAVGLFDHYPWTVFHFALLTWGGLAVGLRNMQSRTA